MPVHEAIRRAQVQKEARHAFGALLDRASASDRIRGVLALLKRYENLFRLPTRIRQASDKELYEQVPRRVGSKQTVTCCGFGSQHGKNKGLLSPTGMCHLRCCFPT